MRKPKANHERKYPRCTRCDKQREASTLPADGVCRKCRGEESARAARIVPGGMTLEEIGAKLGITRERARQIEESALTKLRRLPDARLLREFLEKP